MKIKESFIFPCFQTNVLSLEYQSNINVYDVPNQIYAKTLHVKGTIKFKNGNHYEGEIMFGNLHGEGKFIFKDGIIYEGEFQYNKITGKGKYTFPDGSTYQGNLVKGLKQGQGRFISTPNQSDFEGEWKDGKKHGQGIIIYKDNTRYEGSFQNGYKHGQGVMIYPSLNQYEGQWELDKKSGFGIMTWQNEKYEGQWSNNNQNGIGIHTWQDTRGEGKFLKNRYEGEWQNGLRNGYGVFYYANGTKYEGYWLENKKHGKSIFTNDQGQIQKCKFAHDKLLQSITLKTQHQNQLKETNEQDLPDLEYLIQDMQTNSYYNTFDISDLFFMSTEYEYNLQIKEISKILLRHNLLLKQIFRQLTQTEVEDDDHFSINLENFWKILNDSKSLCIQSSIPELNRLFFQVKINFYINNIQNFIIIIQFLQSISLKFLLENEYNSNIILLFLQILMKFIKYIKGVYNHFRMKNDIEQAKLKQNIQYNYYEQLQSQDIFVKQFIKNGYILTEKTDLHDMKTVLFYRQYIELILRLSYLKNGSFTQNLHKVLERLIDVNLSKLNTEDLNKMDRHDPFRHSQTSKQSKISNNEIKIMQRFSKWKEQLLNVFNLYVKKQLKIFNIKDQTILVKDVIKMLNNMDLEQSQIDFFIETYQLNHDQQKYDNKNQDKQGGQKDQDKKKANQKQEIGHTGVTFTGQQKLLLVINQEIIFKQFYELLLFYFIKESKSAKILVIEQYVNKSFQSFIDNNLATAQIKDLRIQQYTIKDQQVDELKQMRIEQKRNLEIKQQNENKKAQQKKEIYFMKQEDFDVQSDSMSDNDGSQRDSDLDM